MAAREQGSEVGREKRRQGERAQRERTCQCTCTVYGCDVSEVTNVFMSLGPQFFENTVTVGLPSTVSHPGCLSTENKVHSGISHAAEPYKNTTIGLDGTEMGTRKVFGQGMESSELIPT